MRLRSNTPTSRSDRTPPEQPRPQRYCLGCGYYLDGLPRTRCPECGREFDPDDPKTFGPMQAGDAEMVLLGMALFGWGVTVVAMASPHGTAVVMLVSILQAVVGAVSWSGRPKCPDLEPGRYRLARRAWLTSGLYIALVLIMLVRWAL